METGSIYMARKVNLKVFYCVVSYSKFKHTHAAVAHYCNEIEVWCIMLDFLKFHDGDSDPGRRTSVIVLY